MEFFHNLFTNHHKLSWNKIHSVGETAPNKAGERGLIKGTLKHPIICVYLSTEENWRSWPGKYGGPDPQATTRVMRNVLT